MGKIFHSNISNTPRFRCIPLGYRSRAVILLVALGILTATIGSKPALALSRGALVGMVKNASDGEPIPGATIYIRELGKGTSTDVDGNFIFPELVPGLYTIECSSIGFKIEKRQSVSIKSGETTELVFALETTILPLGEEVVVVGRKPLLQLDAPATQRVVDVGSLRKGAIVELEDIVAAQPGVVELENELHVRGGRTYENLYLVDGVSVTDPYLRRGYGIAPSTEATKSIEVFTGGLKAEYGDATAGVVDVRTRDGGKAHQGSITYKNDHLSGSSGYNSDEMALQVSGPLPLLENTFLTGDPELGPPTYLLDVNGRVTDSYLGTADELYSSSFGGTSLAPRQDNRYGWLGKLSWRPGKQHKLALSFSGSSTINQDRGQLDTRVRSVTYSHGYPFEYSKILDSYNTYTHRSDAQTLRWDVRPSDRTFWNFTLGRFVSQLRSDVQGKHWSEYAAPVDTLPAIYELSEDSTYFTIGRGDGFYDGGDGDLWYDHHIETWSLKADYSHRQQTNFTYGGGFSFERQDMQVIDIFQPWLGDAGYGLNYDIYQVAATTAAAYGEVSFI